jgi:DNA-3-methyladenine glycosylase II
MSFDETLRLAEQQLCEVDPVLRTVISEAGPCGLDQTRRRRAFAALTQTIIAQQISVHAARSIGRRVRSLFGGRAPSARQLLAASDEELRAAGLSRQKVAYLKDLAARVSDRRLSLAALERMTDDEVIESLTAIKGIGRWTAEVFMLFRLGRLDLLPVDDLGLLDGARILYDLRERPSAQGLLEIGEPWRPYRSVGAWYLWQGRRMARGDALR